MVFTGASSNIQGSEVSIILENNFGLVIEVSLRFKLPTTTNQPEYEVLIDGVMLAGEMGAYYIKL